MSQTEESRNRHRKTSENQSQQKSCYETLATWIAKWKYVWNKETEAGLHTLSARVAEVNAQAKTIADGCTSITRIVLLSDSSGGIVKEAYLTEPLSETWRNGFGATNECQALRAEFSLDDVQTSDKPLRMGSFS
jgi:hypothetical protein